MASIRSYRTLAYEFRIRTNRDDIGLAFDRLLRPFRTGNGSRAPTYSVVERKQGPARFIVYGRRRCLHRAASPSGAIDFVLWDAHGKAIAGADGRLVLHAAAASWLGRGILFPAPPDSGKTTLIAGLTRAGFDYLTDEAALIDPATGRLHPFPRALCMDRSSIDVVPDLRRDLPGELLPLTGPLLHVPPEVLRSGSVGRSCGVGYVVAPSYDRGASTALETITKAAAVSLLAQNSFNFAVFGARGLSTLAKTIQDAECYRLRIGDLSSAVRVVQQLVGSRNRK